MAAILICLVVAGSLLANSFVAGRMTVAASNKQWLPSFLGFLGHRGTTPPASSMSAKSDAPINALILSALLAALYIFLGNFRALLTFNGLGEYTFFFMTVIGAILLRYREPHLERPYKPTVTIPVIFAIVSGFVVLRGAVYAPLQAAVLGGVWVVGLGFFRVRRLWVTRE